MSSAYFVPLIFLPSLIAAPGKYVTRCGEVVTVAVASTKHNFGCRGTYANGVREGWHKSGRLFAGMKSANDIVGAA